MQIFKTLFRVFGSMLEAIASPLSYISTDAGAFLPGSSTRDSSTPLITSINISDLWTFFATEYSRDFYQALNALLSAGTMLYPGPNQTPERNQARERNLHISLSPTPILPFTMFPNQPGTLRVRFLVGPTGLPFDVHTTLLASASLVFTSRVFFAINTPKPLPDMTPEAFGALTKWLYTRIAPTFSKAEDLQLLCETWVAAAQLGMHGQANALLRIGKELMSPPDRECGFGTARWVFKNTPPSSPLRGYIVALLAQRSQPDFSSPFQHGDVDIWKARNDFMRVLVQARKRIASNAIAQNSNGGVLHGLGQGTRALGTGVGLEHLPVPEFLVWEAQGAQEPVCFRVWPDSGEFEDGLVGWLKGE